MTEPKPIDTPKSQEKTELDLISAQAPDQKTILAHYGEDEQTTLETGRHHLSTLARFIGKDFDIPVKFNNPGTGWGWNFALNEIYCDPKDILEKDSDYLKHVIGHEASHRRITRYGEVDEHMRKNAAFMLLCNSIEDPRVNNFLVAAYPLMRELTRYAYEEIDEFERKAVEKMGASVGFAPRHDLAGLEFIRLWMADSRGEKGEVDDSLPEEVQAVVKKCLASAKEAWWTYPSKQEADAGEDTIKAYSDEFLRIVNDEIWPEFKKLVDADVEDQKLEDFLREQALEKLKEFWDSLTGDQKQELENLIEQALDNATDPNKETDPNAPTLTIPLDKLSDELKQKIKDYLETQTSVTRDERERQAQKNLFEFDDELNADLGAKLDETTPVIDKEPARSEPDKPARPEAKPPVSKELQETIEEIKKQHESVYNNYRAEVLPLINRLEAELSNIFTARRQHNWQAGYRSGKRIDIGSRMSEKARGVAAPLSHAWERRELPTEKDYAFTLLVDLSGSMRGEKITETLKATIMLTEVLNRLSIPHSVVGFNAILHPLKDYDQTLNDEVRDEIGKLLYEVRSEYAWFNSDGWALSDVSHDLEARDEPEQFLIVLSDGQPAPSVDHAGPEYDLTSVVARIMRETNQKLIGIGLKSEAVRDFYPTAIVEDDVAALSEILAKVIEEAISQGDKT